MRRLILALVTALVLAAASAPTVLACEDPEPKCNSGRGNASETTPENDCDPGNSGDHNNGGD